MTDNSERSQIPTTSNPVDTAMIGELKRLSGDHRGYLGDQLGNAALRMQGLIEEIEQLKDETDGLRAAARHARKMRDAEIERLTRERDEACNKLSALHEGAGFSDETTAVPAITLLEKELQADRAYAWSWHCNIAVPIMDQFGCSHESANRSAAELMRHLFQVDVTTFPEWKSFGWNQDKCECGCCLPAPGAVCAGCGKRAAEKASDEPLPRPSNYGKGRSKF